MLPYRLIATGGLSGLSPKMPGTVGTVAFVAFWYLINLLGLMEWGYSELLLTTLIVIVGTYCTKQYIENSSNEKDPKEVVIDEWAGMAIALLGISPSNPLMVVLAFALFRVLDIFKPPPVGWAEQLPAEYGIMADDIVAGLITFLVLLAI